MARVELHRWPGHPDGFTRAERLGGSYELYFPDPLVGREFDLSAEVLAALEDAAGDLARLDVTAAVLTNSEALARLLLRAEAVGSSQIEGLVVGARRLLRAEMLRDSPRHHDVTAEEVLGSVDAMTWVTDSVRAGEKLEVEHLLEAHRRLMAHAPNPEYGGEVRFLQNWIGGRSPAEAYYVPPPAHLVPELLADLMQFVRDSPLPVLAKTGIAHAQFETIHPFADGNGRTGRALIHLILRAEGLVERTVPPVSLSLATHASRYVEALTAFRHVGKATTPRARAAANDWLVLFSTACSRATEEAFRFEQTAAELKATWRERAAPVRAGSAVALLIETLPAAPVLTLAAAAQLIDRSQQAANQALARLVEARVLRELTDGRRNRVYEAPELIDAFTLLERRFASPAADTRIERPSRPVPSAPPPTRPVH
ncbi:Fic family protein [Kribbella sp. VKM Ac-2527]|uniref:Fic family protein n=1 Tax=Kribbella caucasensis TaxID=2512215 RepID=A0A4V3CAW4_9ACTN|nr:Fic family protein [Kribbella sp. VKM Ac-2527]TDO52672.1 Fic family protein [Kribbella sp. VKM Ac-2527]